MKIYAIDLLNLESLRCRHVWNLVWQGALLSNNQWRWIWTKKINCPWLYRVKSYFVFTPSFIIFMFPAFWRSNWHLTLWDFKVYSILIWYMCMLRNDHCLNISCHLHLSPLVVTISFPFLSFEIALMCNLYPDVYFVLDYYEKHYVYTIQNKAYWIYVPAAVICSFLLYFQL